MFNGKPSYIGRRIDEWGYETVTYLYAIESGFWIFERVQFINFVHILLIQDWTLMLDPMKYAYSVLAESPGDHKCPTDLSYETKNYATNAYEVDPSIRVIRKF